MVNDDQSLAALVNRMSKLDSSGIHFFGSSITSCEPAIVSVLFNVKNFPSRSVFKGADRPDLPSSWAFDVLKSVSRLSSWVKLVFLVSYQT